MEENRSRLASSSSLRQDEKIPDDISEIISVTSDPAPNGSNSNITERDAAHIRFRQRGPLQSYRCSSCSKIFEASNTAEIMEHFVRNEHEKRNDDCLYCHGPVFLYTNQNCEREIYHNCLPFRREIGKRKKSCIIT